MTRARNSANLASHGNLFVDIANDRTGIGSVVPAQNLHVAGTAGFHADVTFTGDLYNTTWDRSDNSLKFGDNSRLKFGNTEDAMHMYHDSANVNYIISPTNRQLQYKSDGGFLIRGGGNQMVANFLQSAVTLYQGQQIKLTTVDHGINVTGTTDTDGLVVSGVATVTTMNVTGVLTYDDVTSVDSVGIVTARQGVRVTDDGNSSSKYISVGASNDLKMYHDGTDSHLSNNTGKLKLGQGGTNVELYYGSVKCFHTHGDNGGSVGMFRNLTAPDSVKIMLGSTSDLQLYHDGSNSRIHNTNAGSIIIRNEVQDADINILGNDGGSNITMLGFDASESGNATFSGDVKLTDGKKLNLGQSNDLSLTHTFINNSHNGVINNSTNVLFIESDITVFRDKSGEGAETLAQFNKDGNCALFHNNSKKIETTAYGIDVTGTTGTDGLAVSGVSTFSGNVNVGSATITNPSGTALDFNGSITASDVVTAGALLHEGDTDTLVHFSAANTIELKTGGSSRVAVNNSGLSLQNNATFNTNGGRIILGDSTGGATDDRIVLGNSNDCFLYHDGTNSIIDNNTGDLIIRSDADDVKILAEDDIVFRDNDDSTNFIQCINGGAVELYHNGTKRFETTASGNKATGKLGLDDGTGSSGNYLSLGQSDDLKIYHDGSNNYIEGNNQKTIIRNTSNNIHIQAKSGEAGIDVLPDSYVKLYHDGSERFVTTSWGNQITGGLSVNMATAPTGSYFNYKYGANASDESLRGVSVVGNEAAIEVVATDGGDHAGSLILRGNNDGYAFINSCDNNRLEIVSFAAANGDWEVHGSGHNVSRKDFCIVCDQDGAVELYNDNTKKFETGSSVNINSNHLEITSGQQLRFDNSNNNRTSEILNTGSSGNSQLSFKTNGTERLNITSTGRAIFTSDNGLFIKPATDSNDAKISFSTNNNNSNTQVGHIKYQHQDNVVLNNYGEGFIIGGTESNGCVLRVDGAINIIDSGSAGGNGAILSLGTDQDMRIYHTGGDGFIDGSGVGGLRIRYDDIIISNKNSSGTRRFKINKDQGMDVFATTNGGLNGTDGVTIRMSDHSSEGQIGSITYKHSDNAFVNDGTNECFKIHGSENQTALLLDGRMYISDSKFVLKPTFSNFDHIPTGTTTSSVGCMMKYHSEENGNSGVMSNSAKEPFIANRSGDDGMIMRIRHKGNTEGQISVSGSSVSYSQFMGSHKAQFVDHSKPDLLIGTVLETVDQLATWKYASFSVGVGTAASTKYIPYYGSKNDGETDTITFESNTYNATIKNHRDPMPEITKHVCVKVSDTVGSKAVFGVFNSWENEDVIERESGNAEYCWNDLNVASIGNYFIRMQSGQTPEVGDYVESSGDGTAKVQSDDILRSKTIAKITSTTKQKTYDDGSFLVTCTLHCG